LTAPGAVAEDAEKTAVFHYSKLKQRAAVWTELAIMLHYNVMFARHRKSRVGDTALPTMERIR
jgi:hypothetical protein